MRTAAQFYRQCKQLIRQVLEAIEAGTADLHSINEALDCVRQLPPSTEGLNEWTQKLEAEKHRLESLGNAVEEEWNNVANVLNQALDRGDCAAAEASLEELKNFSKWESHKDASWERRLDECKKRGPEMERIQNDALRAKQELNEGLMLDCVNRAEQLGAETLVKELLAGHKEIGRTIKVVADFEEEMAVAKESKNWADVLNKAGRILGLVPTHKAALSAKKKAERITAQDDFPKTLITLAEDAEDTKRPKMALRYYQWAFEESREPNDALLKKIEELKSSVRRSKTKSKTVVFVGPPSSGKTVMLGSFLYFLQTRRESDVQDVGTDDYSALLRSNLLKNFTNKEDEKGEVRIMVKFPDSTAPLEKDSDQQIPEIHINIEPQQTSKTLPTVELTLLDVAGEHFRAFDATRDAKLDPRVQNYLRSDPEDLIFVLVIPANSHGDSREQVDLQMLFTDFGFFLSRKGNIKNYARLLSFSKWDLYQGNASKASDLLDHYPMLRSITPDDPDDVIKFKAIAGEGSKKFKWHEWSAELFARRIYRTTTGMDDDPWVIRKKKKWFKF